MTGDKSTGDKAAADPATLIRQVRVLERKLARSEESRVRLEEAKDRFDSLHRNLFRELDEQKALVDEKNNMLKSLSSKLSKYLAPQIYQSIFSGRQGVSLETKRKKLTVFFSDIKDFTQITEDLQAEDLASLLNEYFTEMSRIALEHGATIDKFIGDAMLMFFGDPEIAGRRRGRQGVCADGDRHAAPNEESSKGLARPGIRASISNAHRYQHWVLQRWKFRKQ